MDPSHYYISTIREWTWEKVDYKLQSVIPCQRSLHAAATWNDRMYVFGGYDGHMRYVIFPISTLQLIILLMYVLLELMIFLNWIFQLFFGMRWYVEEINQVLVIDILQLLTRDLFIYLVVSMAEIEYVYVL
jgi:hypothetical protein